MSRSRAAHARANREPFANRAFVRVLGQAGLPRLIDMIPHASKRLARAAAVAITLLLCAAAQAQAQGQAVRKCQIDGRLVYQSSPCPIEARIVSTAPQAAAAGPMTPSKKKTLADLLRERDGADSGRPQVREAQRDGANVLRSRMGAV